MDEWPIIPSRENVADDATKWNGKPTSDLDCCCYQGPAFLQDKKSQRPMEQPGDAVQVDVTAEEIRLVPVHRTVKEVAFQRFSNCNRLLRSAAYVHQAVTVRKHFPSETAQDTQPEYVRRGAKEGKHYAGRLKHMRFRKNFSCCAKDKVWRKVVLFVRCLHS